VWLTGAALLLARLAGGMVQVRRLRAWARPAPGSLSVTAQHLLKPAGERQMVPVLLSDESDMPCAIGIRRPAVLLPGSLMDHLTPEQIRVVLAHELAHVRRHDYAVNLGQRVIEALLWFHPAVHWLSRVARDEREHCCDELAAEFVGDRRTVAGALLALEETRAPKGIHSLLPAAGGGSLLRRIERLLTGMPGARLRRVPMAAMVLLAGSGTILLATPARSPAPVTEATRVAAVIPGLVPESTESSARGTDQVPAVTTQGTLEDLPPVVWAGELRPGERLRVRNLAGPIQVRRATGSVGVVRARLSGETLSDLSFMATRDGDGVTVCALRATHGRCNVEGYTWFGPADELSRGWIELTVELPSGVSVTAATFEGDLDLDEIDSDADARTGSGSIDARLVESARRQSDRTFDLRTGTGAVRVAIPPALGGELEARVSDGRVRVEPPLILAVPNSARFRTRLGPGDSRLLVASGGGDIVLTRSDRHDR
jgi:hypothetical protein